MEHLGSFYIDGEWVTPQSDLAFPVMNPANEHQVGEIILGNCEDVDLAVAAAKRAFVTFCRTTKEERLALLDRLLQATRDRFDDLAQALFGKDFKDLNTPGSIFFNTDQNLVSKEWKKLLTDDRRQEREEASDQRAADRKKVERGIELLPDSRRNLEALREQFQRQPIGSQSTPLGSRSNPIPAFDPAGVR